MRIPLGPVDILTLAFISICVLLSVVFASVVPSWLWLVTQYALISLVIIALASYARRPGAWKPVVTAYLFLPVIVLPIIFNSLGDLIPYLWPHYFDDLLIRVDHALFGVHPTVWLERFIHPLLTRIMQLAYISYYPIPVALGAVLIVKRKYDFFDEAIFGLILCFYLSYLGYLLVPAVGPRFTLADLQTVTLQAGPLTVAIQETLNSLEHNKTDAFPSGHTAIALLSLYYGWKFREKTYTAILVPTVLALVLSTVYLRYHYVIDVIAGVLLTALTIIIAPALSRLLSRRSPSGSHDGATGSRGEPH
ncbi:MAG TPA: hypothetical protein DCO77_01695, partial [Nitrospiraceae bacterium]|nr:hypothetical protein [Nitrospiraceae bacterium]